jgi:hypothetical protein
MKIYKVEIERRTFRFREDDARLADGTDPCSLAAGIVARREFGRNGIVRTMREDSHAADGSYYNSQAFIGKYDRKDGTCTGRNIWIRLEFENRPHEEDCFLSGRSGFGKARGYFEGGRFLVSEREAARLCRSWNIARDYLSELYVIGEMGEHVPVWTR